MELVELAALPPSLIEIAIRLADEGIPVRAIARSVKVSSDNVYEALRDALYNGMIVEMPRDDWPAGTTRQQRVIAQGPTIADDEALFAGCQRTFKLTKTEAVMLALLLKRNEATKDQLHNAIEQAKPGAGADPTEKKIIDVYICKMRRKMKPFGIDIETIWGTGYLISYDARERAIQMIAANSANLLAALLPGAMA